MPETLTILAIWLLSALIVGFVLSRVASAKDSPEDLAWARQHRQAARQRRQAVQRWERERRNGGLS